MHQFIHACWCIVTGISMLMLKLLYQRFSPVNRRVRYLFIMWAILSLIKLKKWSTNHCFKSTVPQQWIPEECHVICKSMVISTCPEKGRGNEHYTSILLNISAANHNVYFPTVVSQLETKCSDCYDINEAIITCKMDNLFFTKGICKSIIITSFQFFFHIKLKFIYVLGWCIVNVNNSPLIKKFWNNLNFKIHWIYL